MRQTVAFWGLLGLVLAGCNDPFAILPANRANRVDTLELFAANGTALDLPSGYVIAAKDDTARKGRVRLGIDPPSVLNAPPFDFLYRIDATAGPQFAPFSSVVTPTGESPTGRSGFQGSTQTFDAIAEAQQVGYITNKPIDLTVGLVMFARSSLPNGCFLGIPYYAKIEILGLDPTKRSVSFRILANTNCGYRGLLPGIPER